MGQFSALATEMTRAELMSTTFSTNVLLSLVTGRAKSPSRLGRPGAMSELEGLALKGDARARRMLEKKTGKFAKVRFQIAKQGGTANILRGGNTPTISNVDILRTANYGWVKTNTPIQIPDADLLINQGPEAANHGSIIRDYTDSASHDHGEELVLDLYTGFPTSQDTENFWTAPIGMQYIIYNGTSEASATYTAATNKVIGGLDRTASGNDILKAGFFDESARQFSFALIDEVNRSAAAIKGNGVDLVIVNTDLFYNKVKPLARAEGAQYINYGGKIPQFGIVGFKKDYVQYNNTVITHDPQCPAGVNGGTSQMYSLILEDWFFDVHPRGDFKVSKLIHLGKDTKHGDADVHQSSIETIYRWYCGKPARQGLHADVT